MKKPQKTKPSEHLAALRQLVTKSVAIIDERTVSGTVMYFYQSQPLIGYKQKSRALIVYSSGTTPSKRRAAMREYMTLLGNIKVKDAQSFPAKEIKTLLSARKLWIEQHPGTFSIYSQVTNPSINGKPLPRHERTAQRVKTAEKQFPALQKFTQHPRIKPWVLPIAAALEVAAGLFALLVILPWIFTLIPEFKIPFPSFNLPDVRLPAINLPDWKLPFQFPDLPAWLDTALYWFNKTLPIWIAVAIAIRGMRRNAKRPTDKN